MPILARGLGAGAFHACISVEHGIVDDDAREIAAGMTHWRRAALDLADVPDMQSKRRHSMRAPRSDAFAPT